MFGTVARMRVKPGAEPLLMAWSRAFTTPIAGLVHTTVYRARGEDDVYWLAVVFESEQAYRTNAASPEQHRRWQQLRSVLVADPEWHDGDVVVFGGEGRPFEGVTH